MEASNILNTVSISQFNKGLAGKIFEDVKKNGSRIVLKNNAPECVLFSPSEYEEILKERKKWQEMVALQLLEELRTAEEECAKYGTVSEEDLCREFNVNL